MASYEEEQAQLKQEYEGGNTKIKIVAPKEPEVNPEVYKDVESMLFRGFLTVSASINGVHFVFKSLNHHEFDLIKFSGDFLRSGSSTDYQFWDLFIAYGVFMVNGVNILPDRSKWLTKLSETFGALPKDARSNIIRYIGEINRKASSAVQLTEAYSMELYSRYRWLQLSNTDLTSVSVTGIDGTEKLGLNWAQQLWRALNNVEDRHDTYEREWENAKFIGSCFAGKGISKVYAQDQDRRHKEREERALRKDRVLREVLLREKFEDVAKGSNGIVIHAKNIEELTDQLEKDLRGEKDWHDQVVEAHEARIRNNILAQQQHMVEADRDAQERFGNNRIIGGSESQEPLTQAQAQELLQRRKQLMAQAASRVQVRPNFIVDEKTEKFANRWLGDGVTTEVSTTDRDTSTAVPVPAPRTPRTPFQK